MDARSKLHTMVSNEISCTKFKIEGLRFQPKNKSKIFIPLWFVFPWSVPSLRMMSVSWLRISRKNGYMEGNGVFYVALEDNESKTSNRRDHFHLESALGDSEQQFEAMLTADLALKVFCEKMFHVWNGNHRI